uniref:Uncharacterized protein n=1 Tax=Rhizophora mucronata TaxID=61149 RepID=A0A2P2QPB1_RHIMU
MVAAYLKQWIGMISTLFLPIFNLECISFQLHNI